MPNRMLRDWTDSDKINSVCIYSERFFTRLIMKVDDFGRFHADTRLLKANLFPLLLDTVREADLLRWMTACQKAELIVLYEVNNKKYLQIIDFKQRLDRAKAKFPAPPENNEHQVNKNDTQDIDTVSQDIDNHLQEVVNEIPPELEVEVEVEKEEEQKEKEAKASAPTPEIPKYSEIDKSGNSIAAYIRQYKPKIIEPYKDLWNLFAADNGFSQIRDLTNSRKSKFKIRIQEKAFDFVAILFMAKQSKFLKEHSFLTFDWILENDNNYMKVIEGNYKNNESKSKEAEPEVDWRTKKTLMAL